MRVHIPIRLPSLANLGGTLKARLRIKGQQKTAVRLALLCARNNDGQEVPPAPWAVTIARTGPRKLDDDNLQGACKYVRDAVAAFLDVDDGSPLYTWKYEQRVGKYGVEITITKRES